MTVFGIDATFSATWTNVGDFLARVGLKFDSTKTPAQIGTLSSDFAFTTSMISSSGTGFIGIYGWSVSPLHEYYIVENWINGRTTLGTNMGTITVDGAPYDVYKNTQTNQPSIQGTATFDQFWSIRQTPRTCGHISISEHFSQWANMGLQLGNLEETRVLVEAVSNSGSIDFTTATVVLQ